MRVNVAHDSPTFQPGVSEVYCGQCHLATPSWREKCIHCYKPLAPPAGSGKGRAARLESESRRATTSQNEPQVCNGSHLQAAIGATHGVASAATRIF